MTDTFCSFTRNVIFTSLLPFVRVGQLSSSPIHYNLAKKHFHPYIGVVTYCRNDCTPVTAEEGLTGMLSSINKQMTAVIGCYGDQTSFSGEELQALDAEGRTIITEQKYRLTLTYNPLNVV